MKVIAHKKMQEGLEQMKKAQKVAQGKVRQIDTKKTESAKEKPGEAIDTYAYETIQVSKPTNTIEESMTEGKEEDTQDQNKYGIMRILTNPNRKEVPIDEN